MSKMCYGNERRYWQTVSKSIHADYAESSTFICVANDEKPDFGKDVCKGMA